jgi:hypothetical protein
MELEEYLQLLSRRRMRGKISERKYARLITQLMLWTVVVEYMEDEDPDGAYFDPDFWIDDEELDFE